MTPKYNESEQKRSDNEATQLYGGPTSPGMPQTPRKKRMSKAQVAAVAGGVAAGGAAMAGGVAYAMSDTNHHEDLAEAEVEVVSENDTQVEEVVVEEHIVHEAPEHHTPAAEPQHAQNIQHNPAHDHQPMAQHEGGVTPQDPEIEVLGVVHSEDDNMNIAQLNFDNQEVFLIDIDNDEKFDFLAYDENHDGHFSENELADIGDSNITVSDLGGFTDSSAVVAHVDDNPTPGVDPISYEENPMSEPGIYNPDGSLNDGSDMELDSPGAGHEDVSDFI